MILKHWLSTLALACVLTGTLSAQTRPPATGSGNSTSDQSSQLAEQLSTSGLAAVLQQGELARALGLDEDQFMLAQDIIDAYQMLLETWAVFDPEAMHPGTMQALMMIRFMLDMELYSILTDDQQEKLQAIFDQYQNQNATQAATKSPATTSKK